MKVYVETNPETIYSGRVKDEVKTTEIRMWFETDEEIEVQSLSDYTKQVRKEVCEEIKKKADIEFERCRYENYITGEDTLIRRKLYRIDEEKLDQIQGETK